MPTKTKITKTAELTESEALAALDAAVRDNADVLAAFGDYRRAVTYASARRNHQANESVRRHNDATEPVRQLFAKANDLYNRWLGARSTVNVPVGVLSGHTPTRAEIEALRVGWIETHKKIADAVGQPMVDLDDPDVEPVYVRLHGAYEKRNPLVSASTLRSGMPLPEALEKALRKAESAWAAAAVAEG